MADFLGRLVRRVWREMPTVQPYLPSLFAPGRPLAVDAVPALDVAHTVVPPPAAAPDGQAAHGARRPAAPPLDAVPSSAMTPVPVRVMVPLPQRDEAIAAAGPHEARQASRQALRPAPSADAATGGPARPHPGMTAPGLHAAVAPPRQPARVPEETPETLPSLGETPRVLPMAATASAALTLPAPRVPPRVNTPRPAPIRLQDGPVSAFGPRHEPPSATQLEGPEASIIRVTIGRIEVRAVLPPAPPPSRSRRVPAMSLDDYLRTRQGGRR